MAVVYESTIRRQTMSDSFMLSCVVTYLHTYRVVYRPDMMTASSCSGNCPLSQLITSFYIKIISTWNAINNTHPHAVAGTIVLAAEVVAMDNVSSTMGRLFWRSPHTTLAEPAALGHRPGSCQIYCAWWLET